MVSKAPFVFLLVVSLSLVLLLLPFVSSELDSERQCKQRCRREHDEELERRICEHRCEERGQEEQCEKQCRGEGGDERQQKQCRRLCEEEAGAGRNPEIECWEQCRRESEDEEQRRHCELQCKEKENEEEKQRQRGSGGSGEKEKKEREEEERENPYVWKEESFTSRYSSEGGFMKTLPNFAEKWDLLKGLENYRLSWSVLNPSTVVAPHHADADSIVYVYRGKGTIGIVKEGKQEVFNVKDGDIMLVPAGSLILTAGTDENEKLCILNLVHTISIPGRAKGFFGIGRKDQESFFKSFSPEILEAAFKTQRDRLMGLFEPRKRVTETVSSEQMQELRRAESGGWFSRFWPFSRAARDRPYNLLDKRPWFSSRRGQIYQVGRNDYAPLHGHDLTVCFAKICAGSMLALSYNSRATRIAIVTRGRGYTEMACPHVSESQGQHGGGQEEEERSKERMDVKGEDEEQQGARYQMMSAELAPMTVFVVPAGHPVAVVADEDLHIVCFDINSRGDHKYMVAGKDNIYSSMKGVMSELAFGVPSRESQQTLGAQDESVILAAPKERPGGGGGKAASRGYESA